MEGALWLCETAYYNLIFSCPGSFVSTFFFNGLAVSQGCCIVQIILQPLRHGHHELWLGESAAKGSCILGRTVSAAGLGCYGCYSMQHVENVEMSLCLIKFDPCGWWGRCIYDCLRKTQTFDLKSWNLTHVWKLLGVDICMVFIEPWFWDDNLT